MKKLIINGSPCSGKLFLTGSLPYPLRKKVVISDQSFVIGHYNRDGQFVIVFQTDDVNNLDNLIMLHDRDYPIYETYVFKVTSKIERI